MKDARRAAAPPVAKALDTLLDGSREELKAHFPLPPRRQRPGPAPRKLRPGGVAAGMLAALSLWLLDPVYQQESYASSTSARREVVLADGTLLALDLGSEVSVRWRLRTRQVELLAGRALFSVAPAWLRPFDVAADTVRIRVLGTRFDVRRGAGQIAVNVAEGRVSVADQSAALQLTAGQRVVRQDGRLGPIETIVPDAALAWRDGRVHFERTPLEQALAEFQPPPAQAVRTVGGARQLAVSGVFDSARADDFLALLPEILPVALVTAADGALEIRKK